MRPAQKKPIDLESNQKANETTNACQYQFGLSTESYSFTLTEKVPKYVTPLTAAVAAEIRLFESIRRTVKAVKIGLFSRNSFKLNDYKDDNMGFGSRMDCCGQFVKYSLFVANFLIFIGGATVFCLSIWTLVDRSFMNELLGTNLFSGAVYVLIVTSVCVCILSFVGCMGAAKEVKCLLLTYFIIVFLIFVSMLIGGILGYVFREKVSQTMRQEMRASLGQYGSRRAITQAWDQTQERLRCCGVDSWHDWNRYGSIPESCCQEIFGGQRKQCTIFPSITNLHSQGCLNVTTTFIRDHAAIIGGSGIGVAIIMIFGLIFSSLLFNMIE